MEPNISPLAKRLAEENNVTWQALAGTGEGGKIVERDVLEYLAKVMSGEEDVNPTAEPLPAGMEAWPEQDVAAYFGQDDAGPGRAGQDRFGQDQFGQGMAAPTASASSPDDDLMLDMDSLDMDSPSMAGRSGSGHDASRPAGRESDLDDDIFLFEEEDSKGRKEDFGAAFGGGAERSARDVPDDGASPDTRSTDALSDNALLDNALSGGILSGSSQAADTRFDSSRFDSSRFDSSQSDGTPSQDDFSDAFAGPLAAQDALEAEDDHDDSHDDSHDDGHDMALFTAADAPQEEEEDVPLFGVADDAPESEGAPPEHMAFEVDSLAADAQDSLYTTGYTTVYTTAPRADQREEADSQAALQVAPIVSERALHHRTFQESALPLVRYGVLLRRYADLGPLFEAQSAIAQELEDDQSVPLPSLLARAAAKALGTVMLGEGSGVGVARIADGGLQIEVFEDAATQSFRDLLAAEGEASELSELPGRVALVVADLSDFDVDEAVLNVGVPVLTLGRILYDSEAGSHRSNLALSGDLGLEQGTAFLTRVAELLRSPVRLVV